MRSMMRQLCVCVLCVWWCMDSVIDATIFGAHSDTPQFVSMAHDDHEHYKHYFAELLLAFEMTINGETCELVILNAANCDAKMVPIPFSPLLLRLPMQPEVDRQKTAQLFASKI